MNRIQELELEILKEFDRICRENGLSYTVAGGTMIGAIRHKGFVPWDDDIDIGMSVRDYRKFCRIAPKQLSDKFFFQNSYTDMWDVSIAKIRLNGTTAIEEGSEKYDYHHGIWIDIFPMTGVKDSDRWVKIMNALFHVRNMLLKDLVYKDQYEAYPDIYKKIKMIMKIPLGFRRFFCKILDRIVLRDFRKCKYFCYVLAGGNIFREDLSEYADKTVETQFESLQVQIAEGYDEILTHRYGDYMTPPPVEERNGGGHVISIIDTENDYKKYLKREE